MKKKNIKNAHQICKRKSGICELWSAFFTYVQSAQKSGGLFVYLKYGLKKWISVSWCGTLSNKDLLGGHEKNGKFIIKKHQQNIWQWFCGS